MVDSNNPFSIPFIQKCHAKIACCKSGDPSSRIRSIPYTLVYGTFSGGLNNDGDGRISFDEAGNLILIGSTKSTDFPLRIEHQKQEMQMFLSQSFRFTIVTFLQSPEPVITDIIRYSQ